MTRGVFGGGESENGLEKQEMMVVSSGFGWKWLLYYSNQLVINVVILNVLQIQILILL